jgi:hypothetical protein
MSKSNGKLVAGVLAIVLCACAAIAKEPEPPLASMKVATIAGSLDKTGAPVEVRYEPTGSTTRGQPTTLKLAFVPQVASSLEVEFLSSDAVSIDSTVRRMSVAKADRDGVYRRSVLVTPWRDSAELRVMVWIDTEGSRYFSIFTVPVGK